MTPPYEMRLRDVVDVLRRRRRFLLRVWAIGVALGALASLALRPPYRAGALITADKIPPVILLDQAGLAGQNVPTTFGMSSPDLPTLVALAQSEQVRAGAVTGLPSVKRARAARAIAKTLRAQPYRNTQFVRITVDDSNPVVAAEAANAVAESLLDTDLNIRRQWAREARQSIQEQLLIADPKLQAAEEALAAFKTRYGDIPLSEATVATLNRLAQMEAQQVDIRLQQQETKARLDTARSRLASQTQISPTQWKPSPMINTLQAQLASEEIELSGLRQLFTPKHPQVVSVSAKIQETKQKLEAELAHNLHIDQYGVDPVYQQLVQESKHDEVASTALDARDRALTAAIEQYQGILRQLPAREIEQVRIARNVKEVEAIHQVLTNKLQQAVVAEASIGSVIRVVDPARPPMAPVRPEPLGLLLGALLGLVLGVGGALVAEQIEDPIKSVEHGKHVLGMPILGAIPALGQEEHGGDAHAPHAPSLWESFPVGGALSVASGIALEHWRSAFAESFRYLRTNLLCLEGQPLRTLLVTSAGTSDGKDIVAANLAIAFARAGLRVWLVDCDLRKPALARSPGQEAHAGLAEVLDKGMSERALVRQTAVENLWFLPAGTPPPNPAELLGSQRMRAFLQRGHDEADVVVLAAPPVLPVTDAAVLAQAVAGVLLTVHIGTTPREAAQWARQQLDAVGARVLGTVLTGAPMNGVGSYSNYYARYYSAEPSGIWFFGRDRSKSRIAGTPAISRLRRVLHRGH